MKQLTQREWESVANSMGFNEYELIGHYAWVVNEAVGDGKQFLKDCKRWTKGKSRKLRTKLRVSE